ncbi:MAG: hypothetical protein J2P36_08275 [Ktedonobacteraceae bacterium]|nr:hypothetical protein [Ktedonobacteraceae bacterium]
MIKVKQLRVSLCLDPEQHISHQDLIERRSRLFGATRRGEYRVQSPLTHEQQKLVDDWGRDQAGYAGVEVED